MTVRNLTQAPDPDLAWALEDFERQFTYPLGAGHHFRISHGADYPRFFRAIAPDASALRCRQCHPPNAKTPPSNAAKTIGRTRPCRAGKAELRGDISEPIERLCCDSRNIT